MNSLIKKTLSWLFISIAGAAIFGLVSVMGLYLYVSPNLPSIESLKDIKFQVPLRIYSQDGLLLGEFGEKRRIPLEYQDIPDHLIHAILGAEDDRFFEHPGVDYQGILRAVGLFVTTGRKVQGGSTITMQVARNFFLSREKTFLRKFSEILLALKIERELTKEDILTLYLNKIYFGKRAYGVGAAAKTYFGRDISNLTIAEFAMIAGLPKAPSTFNPIVNPDRAMLRRDYVLRRMNDLSFIDSQTLVEQQASPNTAKLHQLGIELEAPDVAEMARSEMLERYGSDAYTEGYKVYTTVKSHLQRQANKALRNGLLDYETRHGYRGPLETLDLLEYSEPDDWEQKLAKLKRIPQTERGIVISINKKDAFVYLQGNRVIKLCWKGMKWASPYRDGNRVGRAPKTTADIMHPGNLILVRKISNTQWALAQEPAAEGALVSLNSHNGAILSIVGGYNFYRSNFNRASQAKRQPGSNFKPFIYSSALEKGFTAASLINDAPVVFDDPGLEDEWRPENYSGKFFGPTRLREALVKSRNLVSIRILRSVGINYATNYVSNFGFDSSRLPKDLSLALGSAEVTPLSIARGYSVFSNGGFLIDPYLIDRIEGADNEVIYQATPLTVCNECDISNAADPGINSLQEAPFDFRDRGFIDDTIINPARRVISPQNVYILTTIMQDIIQRGTGRRALVLKRNDLAGKTGTTNDQRDAWFSGFNSNIVTTTWVGFDNPRSLGDFESGAKAALPIWINFMREALQGSPQKPLQLPPGVVSVKIDPETGLLAGADFPNAIFETFRTEHTPKQMAEVKPTEIKGKKSTQATSIPEQLF